MTGEHARTRNDATLGTLEPFLVATPEHAEMFDLNPFGFAIAEANRIDPTRTAWAGFLDRLGTLDALTFGPEGMPMPRWLFHDASAIPGAIVGFAARAEGLAPPLLERLRLGADASGLVPLSMFIAIPVVPPTVWYGHNLASLNRQLPELSLGGLASITKAVGLRCVRCDTQIGATQWASNALHVHAKLGVLELLTAWTPAHADPATLTYRVAISDTGLRVALGDPVAVSPPRPDATMHVGTHDTDAMRALQARIEAGERLAIVGPPRTGDDGRVRVPVSPLPAA